MFIVTGVIMTTAHRNIAIINIVIAKIHNEYVTFNREDREVEDS